MVEDICNDPFGSGFGSSKMTRRFKESSCKPGKPCHVYLTVSEDLRTSTVVIFHTAKPYNTKPSCKYGELSGDGYPNEVQGETYEIKFDSKRYIHYVGINQLTPNTDYKFICGESGETDDWSDEKQFRTSYNSLSDGKITFAVGADTNVIKETNQITEMMANNNPNFAAIAGDLALTNGNVHCYRKWDKWLSNWGKYAKSNNNLIPILPTIGNHETQTGYRKTEKPDTTIAPFFMTLFQHNSKIKKDPFTQKTYQVSRITDVIAFISLDTNHVYSEVEQEDWVEENLVKLRNEGVKYIFPIYHVPAFPSDRKFSVQQSLAIRESWVKLFDKHDITLAFEGHSHMLKVTKPIRDGLVVEQTQGTRYLGDGAWGRLRDRRDTTVTRWYEDHVDSIRHVWMVDVDEDNLTASAKNDKNEIQASIHY
ncbi:purple acid phosphatase [Anaeramoeba flamelloides]|uniref:Purple acid phosphatase n=1 Tax=Anaeramoeba flamelloides TaxID=1746091 RepID=A0ABQ8Z3W9_9EUKA|nr:purple acid phosphatase [Anaeramoeba flamelloides]